MANGRGAHSKFPTVYSIALSNAILLTVTLSENVRRNTVGFPWFRRVAASHIDHGVPWHMGCVMSVASGRTVLLVDTNRMSGCSCMDFVAHGQIMKGAAFVVDELQKGVAVLVHCSDGWDRTSQLTALAQVRIREDGPLGVDPVGAYFETTISF